MSADVPPELWIHKKLGFFYDSSNKKSEKHYHGNDDSMRARFLPAHRYLPWSWLLLLISILWMFISIYLDIREPKDSESCFWFQRSGAVSVLASLWVEWLTSRAELGGSMSMAFNHISPSKRYIRIINVFSIAGLFFAILGTFVWAYGDMFIS